MTFKFGKKPARAGAVKLALNSYLASPLPPAPAEFGYEHLMPSDWGMLANDSVGDCVIAGGDHETMLWNEMAKRLVNISSRDALADYSAITGYDPNDPATDQGTDMVLAASYRRKVGLIDNGDVRHKIGAYVSVTPGNLAEHKFAAWTFGAIGLGLMVSGRQIDQFNAGRPWDGPLSSDKGGHYVPMIGFRGGYILVVTWGKVQRISTSYFQDNNDESIAYFSEEMMYRGAGPSGLYLWRLRRDLAALGAAQTPALASIGDWVQKENVAAIAACKAYLTANMPSWELSMVPEESIVGLSTAIVKAVDQVREQTPPAPVK